MQCRISGQREFLTIVSLKYKINSCAKMLIEISLQKGRCEMEIVFLEIRNEGNF